MIKGIIKENPIFVLVLGLCSALAVTTKFENAYMMGLCLLFVLIFSNLIVSLLRHLIPDNVKIPVIILIIGTFVTILEILMKRYIPGLYSSLGIYLPLMVVNCIILGRALSVASKTGIKNSLKDAVMIGLGYTLALMMIALVREVLGNCTITLMDSISSITGYRCIIDLPKSILLPMTIFTDPAGAFLTLGFLIALFSKVREGKNGTN